MLLLKHVSCSFLFIAARMMIDTMILSEGFVMQPTGIITTSTFLTTSYHSASSRRRNECVSIVSQNTKINRAISDKELSLSDESAEVPIEGPDDIVACKITVTGDVNGGYYRACVLNEVCEILFLSYGCFHYSIRNDMVILFCINISTTCFTLFLSCLLRVSNHQIIGW
jgi:hypothetical protein